MYLIESFWFLLRLKHTSLILTFVVGRISHIKNLTFVFCVIDAANLSQVLLTSHFRTVEQWGESASPDNLINCSRVTHKKVEVKLIQFSNTAL